MGFLFSKVWKNILNLKKDVRVVLLGLDGAGKTTLIYNLKMGEIVKTIPTIGFNVENLEYKNLKFTVWDVGGQYKIRKLWKHYYQNSDAIIFVVDSNDIERIEEVREELDKMLIEEDLKNCSLLVFANKQDLNNSASPNEITKKLGMENLKRKWIVQGASATTGQGLKEGLDWLAEEIYNRK